MEKDGQCAADSHGYLRVHIQKCPVCWRDKMPQNIQYVAPIRQDSSHLTPPALNWDMLRETFAILRHIRFTFYMLCVQSETSCNLARNCQAVPVTYVIYMRVLPKVCPLSMLFSWSFKMNLILFKQAGRQQVRSLLPVCHIDVFMFKYSAVKLFSKNSNLCDHGT